VAAAIAVDLVDGVATALRVLIAAFLLVDDTRFVPAAPTISS
jgi:hypothetical protein